MGAHGICAGKGRVARWSGSAAGLLAVQFEGWVVLSRRFAAVWLLPRRRLGASCRSAKRGRPIPRRGAVGAAGGKAGADDEAAEMNVSDKATESKGGHRTKPAKEAGKSEIRIPEIRMSIHSDFGDSDFGDSGFGDSDLGIPPDSYHGRLARADGAAVEESWYSQSQPSIPRAGRD